MGLKRTLGVVHSTLVGFGIDGLMLLRQLLGLPRFAFEARRFYKMWQAAPNGWRLGRPFPIMTDRTENAGNMRGHYFHMDLFMAQQVVAAKPAKHLDVGSRIDGFVAHVATTMPVQVGDIRPVESQHPNIQFVQLDLMDEASTLAALGTYPSVSCLHTLEHMGLGRYGDPLDPLGDEKALNTLAALIETGGLFYFATPFGRERLEFNAQRVYGLPRLQRMLAERGLVVERFAYVNDAGDLVTSQTLDVDFALVSTTFNFSCALFICRKI
jgi:hypothetical protein